MALPCSGECLLSWIEVTNKADCLPFRFDTATVGVWQSVGREAALQGLMMEKRIGNASCRSVRIIY
jgi:hypothetical protein